MKLSFEYFPPKTARGEEELWQTAQSLSRFDPEFISVTYGAGGSTQEKTAHVVTKLQAMTKTPSAAHITCVGATKEDALSIADQYYDLGIKQLVVLRGDMPGMEGPYQAIDGGYHFAREFLEDLRLKNKFLLYVAAFPEMHPESSEHS